jgi:hypothetical protein
MLQGLCGLTGPCRLYGICKLKSLKEAITVERVPTDCCRVDDRGSGVADHGDGRGSYKCSIAGHIYQALASTTYSLVW